MYLSNDYLHIEVSNLGGELRTIQTIDGHEFLWQGNKPYWPSRGIHLFPFVGRLYQQSYQYKGKIYEINQHGFLRDSIMEEHSINQTTGFFSLRDSNETKAYYPFSFLLEIHYELIEHTIVITYKVTNQDTQKMYFAIGGHPGFHVPFFENEQFEDYEIYFENPNNPKRILFTDNFLIRGKEEEFSLYENHCLPLKHSLFDHNLVLLKDTGHSAILRSKTKTHPTIRIDYPDSPYLGLWHNMKTDAPFICFEPWSSLPGRDGILEDIETMSSHIPLKPNETYNYQFKITINRVGTNF